MAPVRQGGSGMIGNGRAVTSEIVMAGLDPVKNVCQVHGADTFRDREERGDSGRGDSPPGPRTTHPAEVTGHLEEFGRSCPRGGQRGATDRHRCQGSGDSGNCQATELPLRSLASRSRHSPPHPRELTQPRRVGGVVTQRIANPCMPVRFRHSPPISSMTCVTPRFRSLVS